MINHKFLIFTIQEEASKEICEVKLALEESQRQTKIDHVEFDTALNELKAQAAQELSDVKVALEQSQEEAKVSLHDRWSW